MYNVMLEFEMERTFLYPYLYLRIWVDVHPLEIHDGVIKNPSNIVNLIMFITMVIAEQHDILCFYCMLPHPLIFFRSLAAL